MLVGRLRCTYIHILLTASFNGAVEGFDYELCHLCYSAPVDCEY